MTMVLNGYVHRDVMNLGILSTCAVINYVRNVCDLWPFIYKSGPTARLIGQIDIIFQLRAYPTLTIESHSFDLVYNE